MTATLEDFARLYAVPPHYLGRRFVPTSREEAARERLMYWSAFGVETPADDDDAMTCRLADSLWSIGETDAANELLAPLRVPLEGAESASNWTANRTTEPKTPESPVSGRLPR